MFVGIHVTPRLRVLLWRRTLKNACFTSFVTVLKKFKLNKAASTIKHTEEFNILTYSAKRFRPTRIGHTDAPSLVRWPRMVWKCGENCRSGIRKPGTKQGLLKQIKFNSCVEKFPSTEDKSQEQEVRLWEAASKRHGKGFRKCNCASPVSPVWEAGASVSKYKVTCASNGTLLYFVNMSMYVISLLGFSKLSWKC